MKERERLYVGAGEKVRVCAHECVSVCVCVCVYVCVSERERERARARVEERARDTERGWGKVRGGGEWSKIECMFQCV